MQAPATPAWFMFQHHYTTELGWAQRKKLNLAQRLHRLRLLAPSKKGSRIACPIKLRGHVNRTLTRF
ncbi:hypothetical protein ACFLWA_06235 [Chloroflexota bacterium]